MKRLDDGKVSLVDFLRSIRFASKDTGQAGTQVVGQFARLDARARNERVFNAEESHLVRSAN